MCQNCEAEIDQKSANRQSFLSRTNTCSTSEEASFSDNGEGTDLVTNVQNLEVVVNTDGKDSKKEWKWGYRVSSLGKIEESHNSAPFEIWRKFVRTTTGHGFARMVDANEHWQLRVFWMMVVVLLVAGLLTSVSIISYESLVVRGLQREFIVQYNNTMYLPDIHIFDTSLFSLSALECKCLLFIISIIIKQKFRNFVNLLFVSVAMGFNKTMGSYLALTLSPMLASRSLRKNPEKRKKLEIIYQRLMQNKTIHEVYEKATLKYEILIHASHSGYSVKSYYLKKRFF
jgi:hypothetical protein